ncbi:hypothetical protein ONZ45_g15216 [Pleurotus djamor]|nr:hypothetical protein ONZ45_g15216 [Pleurotus djamor]
MSQPTPTSTDEKQKVPTLGSFTFGLANSSSTAPPFGTATPVSAPVFGLSSSITSSTAAPKRKCGGSSQKAVAVQPSYEKHEEYYFEDGTTTLQIGDIQFKLHRGLLERHAPKLHALGLLLRTPENPLVLEDTNLTDFVRLLSFLYPSRLGVIAERTPEDWISVLKQAHKWEIQDLKDTAATHVASLHMAPADRIQLYRDCGLANSVSLIAAFTSLCERKKPISFAEAEILGLKTMTKIAALRESVLRNELKGSLNVEIIETFSLTDAEPGASLPIKGLPKATTPPKTDE